MDDMAFSSRALALWHEGKDTHDIAQELGVHEAYAYNMLCEWQGRPVEQAPRVAKPSRRPILWSLEQVTQIAAWRVSGWTRKKCGWRLGIDPDLLPHDDALFRVRAAS